MSMSLTTIRAILDTAELVIEQALVAAETLHGMTAEADKKAFAEKTVMEFLKSVEGKYNFVPAAAEPIVFKGLEYAVDFIIDRVFLELDKRKAAAAAVAPAAPAPATPTPAPAAA